MDERHRRCRFWPRCMIHRGWVRRERWHRGQYLFTDDHVADMREDKARGMTYVEIGQLWQTPASYVWKLLNKTQRGMETR